MQEKEFQQFFYKANRQQQLRGFIYTAQFKSFSKAAGHLNLGQPTISMQVKSLEEDLGVQLFDRKGPKISLTKDGQLLYQLGAPLLEQFDHLYETFIKQRDKSQRQQINIAANHGSMQYILPKVIKRYLDEDALVKVQLHFARREEGLSKLLEGEVDLFMTPRNFPLTQEFLYTPLFYFKPILITRWDHPLAQKDEVDLAEVVKYDLALLPEKFSIVPGLHQALQQYDLGPRMRLEFVDWEMTMKYVEAGVMITIGNEMITQGNKSLKGTPLKQHFPATDYGFVVVNGRSLKKKVLDLIEILRDMSD